MRGTSIGNAPAILLIGRAELGDQIALLELQPDQDVGRVREREQQMAGASSRGVAQNASRKPSMSGCRTIL